MALISIGPNIHYSIIYLSAFHMIYAWKYDWSFFEFLIWCCKSFLILIISIADYIVYIWLVKLSSIRFIDIIYTKDSHVTCIGWWTFVIMHTCVTTTTIKIQKIFITAFKLSFLHYSLPSLEFHQNEVKKNVVWHLLFFT